MTSHGMYNLTVDSTEGYRHSARVGLLKDRTGVPVFLLYLRGIVPGHYELHSAEEVDLQIFNAPSSWNKAGWKSLLPFFLSEGSSAHVVTLPLSDHSGSWLSEMIGHDRGLSHRTGIHVLRNYVEAADLVVVPQASLILDGEEHRQFCQTLVETLAPLQHFFFILDFPKAFTQEQAAQSLRELILPDAAAYYPWLLHGGELFPPAALVAAAFQKNDDRYGINQIPANRQIKTPCRPLLSLTPAQMQRCLDNRLNLIQEFAGEDLRLWGGRTISDPLDWDSRFISNRRAVSALREAVHELCESFVLEPLQTDLPHVVDVTLHSALSRMTKLFDPDAKQPFKTQIRIAPRRTEDVLEVEVSFSLPYALDQMSFSLGLTG